MIAIDTNLLVYAHRQDSQWHERAVQCIRNLAEQGDAWAIPWPCLHEFVAIATHARIYDPPSTLADAIDQVDAWFESPTLHVLSEAADHWPLIKELATSAKVRGPTVHDARVAAICRAHRVTELLTADRDFSRFRDLRTRNPLVD